MFTLASYLARVLSNQTDIHISIDACSILLNRSEIGLLGMWIWFDQVTNLQFNLVLMNGIKIQRTRMATVVMK